MSRSAFTPVFEQLKGIVRAQIAEGHWKPGGKIDSERAMAAELGVARLTVSRALNELTAEGLLERRDSAGTFVAEDALQRLALASGQYEGKGPVLGLAVMDVYRMTHPYFAKLVKSLSVYCSRQGRSLQTFSFRAGDVYFRRKSALVNAIAERQPAGLLLAGRLAFDDILGLIHTRVPMVWINNELPGGEIPCVLVDYAQAVFQLTRRLIALGHKRIALLLGTRGNRASDCSRIGYRLAHAAADLPLDESIASSGHFDEESGYARAKALLGRPPAPTAILAADDLIACGAMKAVQEAGLGVPRDISIAGVGNLVSPYATQPSLCTLDIRLEDVAIRAAEMLQGLSAGEPVETRALMPEPLLVERESIGPAPSGAPSPQRGGT